MKNAAVWATISAALIAAVLAPWIKDRLDRRNTDRVEGDKARAQLEETTDRRIERLFKEYDHLRDTYRSEVEDLRGRLRLLESEVAEWRAGIRGVVGVWVAVPASVWDYVREQLPDLPPTRFPGEREIHGEVEP